MLTFMGIFPISARKKYENLKKKLKNAKKKKYELQKRYNLFPLSLKNSTVISNNKN